MKCRVAARQIALIGAFVASFWAVQADAAKSRTTQETAVSAPQVAYAPAPDWVTGPPTPTQTAAPEGSPYRVIYADQQIRFDAGSTTVFSGFRIRLLSPQALSIGSLTLSWNPASQSVTVNAVKIHRGSETIDVLQGTRFAVIQREANLEASVLTGILTASLQAPGLQVGDEIEFSTTIRDRDRVFGNRLFGGALMALAQGPGANRIVAEWSVDRQLRFASSADLRPHQTTPGPRVIAWEWRDPPKVEGIEGAPARFNLQRFVEYSDFADWAQVSRALYPAFDKATALPPGSPLLAEISQIAARSDDPLLRADAALQLVQEKVRYVYVGLDGGNYLPVAADETWRSRFGDCKAKSVLLMALLHGLRIDADYVLVNSGGGDGIDERLPGPHVFDHVIVRATIAGKPYYLDGTLYGDHVLPLLEQPGYRFALPLRPEGASLVALTPRPPKRPGLIRTIEVDATDPEVKSGVTQTNYILGVDAAKYRASLAALPPEQLDRALRGYWQTQERWIEPQDVSWRYDEARSATILKVNGKTQSDWEGSATSGRILSLPRAGFYSPAEHKRPSDQNQQAPYLTDFPSYVCSVSNVRLPRSGGRFVWTLDGEPFDTIVGAERFIRRATITGNVVTSTRISQTFLPEIGADRAKQANAAIKTFDNSMLAAVEAYPPRNQVKPSSAEVRIGAVDWTAAETPCSLDPASGSK